MILDVIALILLMAAIVKGMRNGIVVAVFSFFSFAIGLAAALKLSAVVATRLSASTNLSQKWLPVLAFILVFFAVALLVRFGAKAIEAALKLAMLGWLNKLGGILFYLLLYLLIFSVVLFYGRQLDIIKPEMAELSFSYPFIYPLAPELMSGLSVVLPFLKDMFGELENFFDQLAKKAS